jgi:hypothetical protein
MKTHALHTYLLKNTFGHEGRVDETLLLTGIYRGAMVAGG